MNKQKLFITCFSSVLLFCKADGMHKQIMQHRNSSPETMQDYNSNNMSLKKLTRNENKGMESFIKFAPIVKIGLSFLSPNKKANSSLEEEEKKLEEEKEQLEKKLNEQNKKAGFFTWFLHYMTKVGGFLTGGFVHWGIGHQMGKVIGTENKPHLPAFGMSVFGLAAWPIIFAAVDKSSPIIAEKTEIPLLQPFSPRQAPSLKKLANPLRLVCPTTLITQLAVSGVEACEITFKKYLDNEECKVSPQLIIQRTLLFFAQKKLLDYLVPFTMVATNNLGPTITKKIGKTKYDLAMVNWNLKKKENGQ